VFFLNTLREKKQRRAARSSGKGFQRLLARGRRGIRAGPPVVVQLDGHWRRRKGSAQFPKPRAAPSVPCATVWPAPARGGASGFAHLWTSVRKSGMSDGPTWDDSAQRRDQQETHGEDAHTLFLCTCNEDHSRSPDGSGCAFGCEGIVSTIFFRRPRSSARRASRSRTTSYSRPSRATSIQHCPARTKAAWRGCCGPAPSTENSAVVERDRLAGAPSTTGYRFSLKTLQNSVRSRCAGGPPPPAEPGGAPRGRSNSVGCAS